MPTPCDAIRYSSSGWSAGPWTARPIWPARPRSRAWRMRPPPKTSTASPGRTSISSLPVMPRHRASSCWTWTTREDATHGQQEFSFYNHHYGGHCYLPLFLFEGPLRELHHRRPASRQAPEGAENAMIIKRVLKRLRAAWPETHIVLRGDGHFANPELMQLALDDRHADFIFGLGSNAGAGALRATVSGGQSPHARRRCENAQRLGQPEPQSIPAPTMSWTMRPAPGPNPSGWCSRPRS
jgi:hypothetical protein